MVNCGVFWWWDWHTLPTWGLGLAMCLVHQMLPAARGVPGWSPIQVLTPLDGAWLRWSDGNRYVTATWLCSRMIRHSSASKQTIQHFPRHFLTFDLMECSRMIWAQFSVETNNPAFSRHFLTFDLMECSRTFHVGTVQHRNKQSISTSTRSLDTISFHWNVCCGLVQLLERMRFTKGCLVDLHQDDVCV